MVTGRQAGKIAKVYDIFDFTQSCCLLTQSWYNLNGRSLNVFRPSMNANNHLVDRVRAEIVRTGFEPPSPQSAANLKDQLDFGTKDCLFEGIALDDDGHAFVEMLHEIRAPMNVVRLAPQLYCEHRFGPDIC